MRRSAEIREGRLEFETLISDLSSRFINLAPGEVDCEIEDALRRVCQLLGIDLAVLWQWAARAPEVIAPTHSYLGFEGPQLSEPFCQEQFPWFRQQMLAGRLVALSSLDEFPPEAAVDRENCRLNGVKSNLCLPLAVGGEPPVGCLGFNTLGAERDWPDEVVKRLQLIAQVFTNALVRRRHELNLREAEERLSLAADAAEAGLWTFDYDSGVSWATERARALFGYGPDEAITLERLKASIHPDDWDRVRGTIERSARGDEPVDIEYRIVPQGAGPAKWINSRARPVHDPAGRFHRLSGISIDVTERKRAEEESRGRLELETLIAELSSRFINLPVSGLDREIEQALRRVCEVIRIDYGVLWQWSDAAAAVIVPTHVYSGVEGMPPAEPLSQEQYPWVVRQMRLGRAVVLGALEEVPAEAAVDRESARLRGIQSNLTLPLAVGGEPPIGALAFNSLHAQRDWPDVVVQRLQLVAQVFTNALARRRHELNLRETEERLALAADAAEAGLWTLDWRTGVFWATERARTLFGYAPDETITVERLEASVHPDDWDLVRTALARSAQEGDPINLEYRIISPGDGHVRWVASRGRPWFTAAGEPERLMGVTIDVTEGKHAEEALRTSEARLAAGAELAGLAFYEMDLERRLAHVDDRFRELIGIPPERMEGLQAVEFWSEHLHPDDRPRVLEVRRRLHDGEQDRLSIEYRFLHPARGERWIEHLAGVAARDAGGRAVRTFGVFRDVTERKQIEEELRDLSRRLIRAHEEERALLARELHDDVTQRLAVLAIDVGRAELAAPLGAQTEAMQAVREGLVRLSEDIHSLAYQLHPSVLEELGLVEALRTECERRHRRSGIDIVMNLDPLTTVVGKDASLCLFRVAQEALNNVVRHAGAGTASVTLWQRDGGLLLAVRDDGVGFDQANSAKGRRLGLASMRERVRAVKGTLDIESVPGQGTTVVAWVPTEGGSQ